MPFALRTAQHYSSVGDESAVDGDIVGARGAHPENTPGVEHLDVAGSQRKREMQYGGAILRIVPYRAGDEHVADRSATGKDLTRGDAPATFDAFRLSRSGNPVRATTADEHQVVRGNASQQRLDRRGITAPPPDRGRHLMRVHREGECGRPAIARENPEHLAELAVFRPTAT